MSISSLTIQYVNQPKPGGKMGSIKDTAGTLFMVDPTLLPGLAPGMVVAAEIEVVTFQDGAKRNKITKIVASPIAPAPAVVLPTMSTQPGRNTDQDRFIFITGVVGRAMGSGKFEIAQIVDLAVAAALAWKTVNQQSAPDIWTDGIPVAEDEFAA